MQCTVQVYYKSKINKQIDAMASVPLIILGGWKMCTNIF